MMALPFSPGTLRSIGSVVVGLSVLCLSLAAGCADQQALSRQEMEIQNRADAAVSGLLFEQELDQAASYNVHKDGLVVIKFAESVPLETYTRVVDMLRSNPDIRGVRAEQGGREVCKLKGYR